ncbi:hypothetical protein B7P34_20130 [Streptosporangium nondiastaticum]|uniref:Uncharacterized protein n=1 Tax=Streptosporangium nondiastaticum TaxID=35764 RepID=A0A9X7PGG5_9ACTN|nr:hypothetical protein [Streptosporangium nondiastaticum]PSJ26963.1 hypothetical protein B7P34_20130 [Streptosporangium nondiastaticum]
MLEIATSMATHHHVRVQVTGKTVRTGDVIDFGGRGYTVIDVLGFCGGKTGLRFRTGEELIVESDEELSAVRAFRKR